jgi:hypothetical protein
VIASAGANVLLQGVHPGFHSVPLHHHINLKSNVVSGQVVVGVKPTLSVQYISLLFGIDLPGANAIMDPVVYEEATYNNTFAPAEAITEKRNILSNIKCEMQ